MKTFFQASHQSNLHTYESWFTGPRCLAIVQSSKFIGRTFLLGNYNTLQLHPSDNILQYNKRVLKKQCNYHWFSKQKIFLCIFCTIFGFAPGSKINSSQKHYCVLLAVQTPPEEDQFGPVQ